MSHRLGPAALLVAVVVTVVAGAAPASFAASGAVPTLAGPAATAPTTVTGIGSDSVQPLFARVFDAYHTVDRLTSVSYVPDGSSAGVSAIQRGAVTFGDADQPMSASQLAGSTHGTVLQLPVALGGVAIAVDLPGGPSRLKLDGPTLAAIYDGTITSWASPTIARVTGVADLPDVPITPLHRLDPSAANAEVDEYLTRTSTAWAHRVHTSKPAPTWPVPLTGASEDLNAGMIDALGQIPGSIGFVETGSALPAGVRTVELRNRSGRFVGPTSAGLAAAGSQEPAPTPTHADLVDGAGLGTYPLAQYTWALVDRNQASQAEGVALGHLLDYLVTTGQGQAAAAGDAPLPMAARAEAVRTLAELRGPNGEALFTIGGG